MIAKGLDPRLKLHNNHNPREVTPDTSEERRREYQKKNEEMEKNKEAGL
jgi:hypothetical protein